jgi:rhodanese-related sulfurtransferase
MVRPRRPTGLGSGGSGYASDMAPSKSKSETIGIEEARREIAGGDALAIDVRSAEEWGTGHVPGAIHLPEGELPADDQVESGSRLMIIARDGKVAIRAASRLSEQGYDAIAVEGDMDDWTSEDFNVQPSADADADADVEPD